MTRFSNLCCRGAPAIDWPYERTDKQSEKQSAGGKKRERKAHRAGQIIERGDQVLLVRVYLGCDDMTGKRRYLNKTIHGTKKDARMWLNATLREIDLGIFVEPASESVNAFLDKWL